jgi:hypothetical protein
MAAPTQEQIDALELMIQKAGVIQQMIVGGQTFTFRPIPEMLELVAGMKRELAAANAAAAGTNPQVRYASISKGFE